MEQEKSSVGRVLRVLLGAFAFIIMMFLILWAFQLKGEADKQIIIAMEAREKAEVLERKAIEAEQVCSEKVRQLEQALEQCRKGNSISN